MKIEALQQTATIIRKQILDMVYHAGSGHLGGSFSAVEILTDLYFSQMNIDPQRPDWELRDRFVLSKGHATPVYYAVLAERGYFPKADLAGFRQIDSYLQGHPDKKHTPGVDMSTGSLGQGLSVAGGGGLQQANMTRRITVYTHSQEMARFRKDRSGRHCSLPEISSLIIWSSSWTTIISRAMERCRRSILHIRSTQSSGISVQRS